MIDDMLDYLRDIRSRPVWQNIPTQIQRYFDSPLPIKGKSLNEVYSEFFDNVLPYPMGNIHPRFWGWALGPGTVTGALADFLGSSMNSNLGGGYHGAVLVEHQVINWIKELMGFQKSASGLLTSGCSAANLIGLIVARNVKTHFDIRKNGLQKISAPLVVYASQEIHSSIKKAVEILGLGSNQLHLIPVNNRFQVDIDILQNRIIKDRKDGYEPFCVVGGAGTINTGSFDDLDALNKVCKKENLWFHIDGAFGVWASLVPSLKKNIFGLDKADSLALDLHKWMYMPYEIGCVLIRNKESHLQTFSMMPDYLSHSKKDGGLIGGNLEWFSDFGFQLSRGFRALKAWMSIKEIGMERYGRLIQQNINQAKYLAALIVDSSNLELMTPVFLNIVCFRYFRLGISPINLDEINKKIVVALQEKGIAVLSWTIIEGKYVMRAANFNYRSKKQDFNLLIKKIVQIGDVIASKFTS